MTQASIFSVPSRVPIGRDADGRPVLIERAWLDYLGQQLFNRVGGSSAPTNGDLDSFMQFDIREADSAELEKRVRDSEVSGQFLGAPTAVLAEIIKRLESIETSLSLHASQTAELEELRKRVSDQEISEAFK